VSPKHKPKTQRKASTGKARATATDAVHAAIRIHQQGKVEEASRMYEEILARVPDQADALHFLGVAEHQQGRSERALELMGRAAELAPMLPDIHNNRGNVLKQLGRLDDAEAAYLRVLALRPNDPSATNNLGTVFRERGDLPAAEKKFREAIAIRPEHVDAYRNLGNVLSSQHRYQEALEAHRVALRLQPRAGESYQHLGAMFYAIGAIKDAIDIYEQWLALDPDNPLPRHLLAACTGKDVPARATDDVVRKLFDSFAESFDRSLARLDYRAPELVAGAVSELTKAGERVDMLDAGCGTGLCAPLLKAHAKTLDGVDLSPQMLQRALQRKLYDHLWEGDLTEFLRDHPAAYDLVVSADTLCYFGALEDVALAAASCLRPDGHLVFTTESSEAAEAPDGFRIHPHGRYSHTEAYLRAVLAAAKLDVTFMRVVELRKEIGVWVKGTLVVARASY
jgi:predicted TPR repeat methyltransferase